MTALLLAYTDTYETDLLAHQVLQLGEDYVAEMRFDWDERHVRILSNKIPQCGSIFKIFFLY